MDEFACKRLAIEICANLPENTREALIVLGLARDLVENWLGKSGDIIPLAPRTNRKAAE